MHNSKGPILSVLSLLLTGCASTATYLSSQQSVYYKDSGAITLADTDLNDLFEPQCMKTMPQGPLTSGEAKETPQCLYFAVDASKASTAKSITRPVRDKAIAYLLNVSETNCANFLDRAFANKAGIDATKTLTQDISTGVGAIAAFSTPAVTATLGMANLVIGKTADNISSTFYFNQTFQAFEAAVITERARIKSEIISKQAQRPPVSTDTVVQYTLFDALADVRAYDAACSMRVGLAKLIETQGEKKKAQVGQSSKADREAKPTSLDNAKELISTDMKADGAAATSTPTAQPAAGASTASAAASSTSAAPTAPPARAPAPTKAPVAARAASMAS